MAGPHAEPQTADVPHMLINGNHAVSSTVQPRLGQSGPGRPSAAGTDSPQLFSLPYIQSSIMYYLTYIILVTSSFS